MRIIGVVGPIASGKGSVIAILQKKDYTALSLSDVVREKTKEWGLPLTRENLQNVGDQLRKKFGNTILAELVGQHMYDQDKKFVIDSIRNPAEAKYLKEKFGCYIIGITASAKKRYEMMQSRNRDYDPKTWEAFLKAEERDRGIGQEVYGQQVEKCLQLADVVFDNNSTKEDFEKTIAYFVERNLE